MRMQLRHVGVVTDCLENSIIFYEKYFNFKVVNDQIEKGSFISKILGREGSKVRTVKMSNDDFVLEFLDFGDKNLESSRSLQTLGCTHIAITVENILDLCQDLKKSGVEFISDPLLTHDKKATVCFMKDPNNHFFVELVEQMR